MQVDAETPGEAVQLLAESTDSFQYQFIPVDSVIYDAVMTLPLFLRAPQCQQSFRQSELILLNTF